MLLAKGTDKLLAREIHKLFDLELAVEFVEAKTYDIEAAVRSAVAEKQEAEKQKKKKRKSRWSTGLCRAVCRSTATRCMASLASLFGELPKPMNEVKTDDGYITVWGGMCCAARPGRPSVAATRFFPLISAITHLP